MATLIAEMIRSRWIHGLALVVVVLALVLPADGVRGLNGKPLPLCYFRTATKLPCAGCGLTRSFIHLAHLRVGQAIHMHPASLVLFPFVVYLGALTLIRKRERLDGMAQAVERWRWPINIFAVVFGVLFFAYGLWRIVWLLQTKPPEPPW